MSGNRLVISTAGETLPASEILTGRGFITGKSGAGKSNTARVIAEELVEAGYPVFVIDADGEHAGLAERFDALRAGQTSDCDVQVGPETARELAGRALAEPVPIVLDTSGYVDTATARETVGAVARGLFDAAQRDPTPFLLLVEEIHEYLPQSRGIDDTGEALIRVAKRGRKQGLGLCGVSQRPADVRKDFITQCDWFVWHRLTWESDTRVVSRLFDLRAAETVQNLSDGEALLAADWKEGTRTVQFRRARTTAEGARPSLEHARVGDPDAIIAELATDGNGPPVDRTSRPPPPAEDDGRTPSTRMNPAGGVPRDRPDTPSEETPPEYEPMAADHDRPADDAAPPPSYEVGALVAHLASAFVVGLAKGGIRTADRIRTASGGIGRRAWTRVRETLDEDPRSGGF